MLDIIIVSFRNYRLQIIAILRRAGELGERWLPDAGWVSERRGQKWVDLGESFSSC